MSVKTDKKSTPEPDALQPKANRLLGVYPQKQNGLFMQRIKIPGGRINWIQWRRITQIADRYSQGFPLHITTRQDIELHNLKINDIPIVQESLTEAALNTFGACGDSVRNITICPGCDLCHGAFDLLDLARFIEQYLTRQPVIFNLPRKFKISFSGCQSACAKPWLSDLGFIARRDGLFTVVGAGSLGPKPSPGIELYQGLPTKYIVPLCVASLELFEQYGDRENRRRARFRHIREKLGEKKFLKELDGRLNKLMIQDTWPDIVPAPAVKDMKLLSRLQLPNGNISPKEALELADFVESQQAILRINLEHGLELFGSDSISLPDSLNALANNPIIVACPGSVTCPRGLANCWATADEIRKTLTIQQTGKQRISISGCPNNCAHSAVADIGLVGIIRKENGKPSEHYRILTGGGNGTNEKLAEQGSVIPAGEVCSTIKSLLKKSN